VDQFVIVLASWPLTKKTKTLSPRLFGTTHPSTYLDSLPWPTKWRVPEPAGQKAVLKETKSFSKLPNPITSMAACLSEGRGGLKLIVLALSVPRGTLTNSLLVL